MMKLTVIGCGWLGLPLAQRFAEAGEEVTGTVRSEEKAGKLSELGIRPIVYSGYISGDLKESLKNTELLIICFPPSGSPDYAAQVSSLLNALPQTARVIFTSSTGVYKDVDARVDEDSEVLTEHSVFKAESVIREQCAGRCCILRLAGLFGAGRHPVKHLAGRQGIRNGRAPVNLVHLSDVIEAVITIVDEELFGKTYNLSYPEHPSKERYYTEMAGKLRMEEPRFEDDPAGGKCVDGERITRESGYKYRFGLYEP